MMLMHCSRLVCELISLSSPLSLLFLSLPLSLPPSLPLSLSPSLPLPVDNTCTASPCLCSRLSVLVKYHKLYAVNMKVICDLIRQIKEYRTMLSSIAAQDQWVRS